MRQLWGLFVDDGAAAAWVLGWIVVACLALRQPPVRSWSGPILFAGLLAIVTLSMRTGRPDHDAPARLQHRRDIEEQAAAGIDPV